VLIPRDDPPGEEGNRGGLLRVAESEVWCAPEWSSLTFDAPEVASEEGGTLTFLYRYEGGDYLFTLLEATLGGTFTEDGSALEGVTIDAWFDLLPVLGLECGPWSRHRRHLHQGRHRRDRRTRDHRVGIRLRLRALDRPRLRLEAAPFFSTAD
jgi:hypothetical protein